MKTAVCTISTISHRFKTRALFSSLKEFTQADFFALYIDQPYMKEQDGLYNVIPFDELITNETYRLKKYNKDKRRWASKPFFLSYLLNSGYDAVIYVDNDIYFFNSPEFLFEQLSQRSVLLTPHFYPADPTSNQIWLEANFRVGLYNAGFIGVSKSGREAMRWWGKCCLYNVKKAYSRGLFDDQKYLDLMPVLFDDVEIIKHRGCNVAGWNIETSLRSINNKGELVLNNTWPLIFIHFNYYTIQQIVSGKDSLLLPFWEKYLSVLCNELPGYDPKKEIVSWKILWKTYKDMFNFMLNRILDGK
ncbi:MAG: hypothetical protein N2167_09470 [Flavobacteriales bacterium]|nr:hypothetical protein [Flavobacteriales bacterium]